jgi:hypothetical protein
MFSGAKKLYWDTKIDPDQPLVLSFQRLVSSGALKIGNIWERYG